MIKNNKVKGCGIEREIVAIFDGDYIDREYDVETDGYIIEVKSCNMLLRARNQRYSKSYRMGGFWVNKKAHTKIKKISKEKGKKAIYVFCITYLGQKLFWWKSLRQVDLLLSNRMTRQKIPITDALKNGRKLNTLKK